MVDELVLVAFVNRGHIHSTEVSLDSSRFRDWNLEEDSCDGDNDNDGESS